MVIIHYSIIRKVLNSLISTPKHYKQNGSSRIKKSAGKTQRVMQSISVREHNSYNSGCLCSTAVSSLCPHLGDFFAFLWFAH